LRNPWHSGKLSLNSNGKNSSYVNFLRQIVTVGCRPAMFACVIATAVCLLSARGAGAQSPPGLTADATRAAVAAEADLDGDGHLDVVTESCDADCEIDVALSRLTRSVRLETATLLRGLVAADVDSDGDVDLVTLGRDGTLAVWANDGTGHFNRQPRAPSAPATPFHDPATWHAHIVADLSGQAGPSPLSAHGSFAHASNSFMEAWRIDPVFSPAPSAVARPDRGPPSFDAIFS
jgi:hypothetical protein